MSNTKKTISLEEFKKEFDKRHDFESEDLQVLQENFPDVDFYNIPEAWIIPIDKMLQKIGDNVEYVSQSCGFLRVMKKTSLRPGEVEITIPGNESDEDKLFYSQVELVNKILRAIDEDLHHRLDYE